MYDTMRILIAIGCLLFGQAALPGQSAHRLLREGNEAYKEDAYVGAEEAYRKSLESKGTTRAHYNLGNAIYQQGRYEEAVRRYEHVAEYAEEPGVRAQAYHNMGNAHFQAQAYEKSVEAFKNALREQPGDRSTQYNLAQAQRQLKMQQQQQQQQQQQEENDQEKQDQDQQQQQDQQQPDQEQQQQNNQQQQNQQPSEGEDQNPSEEEAAQQQQGQSDQQQPLEKRELSEEEARRLLRIIEEEELQVLEKLRKAEKGQPIKKEKDW